MILTLLLTANGTVAFAAQQEEIVKQNETEQVEQSEQATEQEQEQEQEQKQKETYFQKSKQALKTYFIRDTKTKTGLNIAAKAITIASLYATKLLLRTHFKIDAKVRYGILPAILALRELTNY